MNIELVYALPHEQKLYQLEVKPHCTVHQAIEQSTLLQDYPELSLENLSVGIFSKPVSLSHVLQADERIEIYRPLIIDPKEARRKRAKP